jgi:hypothetical protein
MTTPKLIGLHFDKGNGAIFSIEYHGQVVNCWLSQANEFLSKKASPRQNFCDISNRYENLIADAAVINIENNGVSTDIWGNEITTKDINFAQLRRRHAGSAA